MLEFDRPVTGIAPDPETPAGAPVDRDWWRGAVIYQVYPRSFQDSNGDGIGDLEGITRRLDHIAALGADAVWISPFMRSPMEDFGYDVSDYRDVDPIFGTLADFATLVARAHALGLKVMIDLVLSHSSDRHPWFMESRRDRTNPRADWYVWADAKPEGSPPNNWLSNFGGSSWEWDAGRGQYYLHNFLISQPDLNFHHPAVQDAMLDVVRFWLDRGVDGFRLDTVNFYVHDAALRDNPPLAEPFWNERTAPRDRPYNWQDHLYDKNQPENLAFLQRFRALLDEYPAATAIGEVGELIRGLELMGEYTRGTDRLHMCYAFDFLNTVLPEVDDIRPVVERFSEVGADGWPCWAFSNHDVTRHATRWAEGHADREAILRLAAAILLTMRGSVCLYQGEEIGQTEAEIAYEDIVDPWGKRFWPTIKGRDGCRTPMVWEGAAPQGGFTQNARPWLPIPAEHLALAVDGQAGREGSLLEFYRAFLAFRRAHPALVKGEIAFHDLGPGLLAFDRILASERIVCVFNLSGESADLAGIALLDGAIPIGPGREDAAPDPLRLPRHGFLLARRP
ncbi:alpha-amylase family glycosyl hydrolase [Aureimonas pseudogalii]|uniref:Alpha-glucosidase n=1 Tax=Aureimonas pseudogalii TaxID=1744844 RepID=A0A7W6EFQ1_9HYPH|nr:alpha-amylase family glycosyl hydrolase [Aureimonas pseudogalii]MBB3997019.1 alpha-glucosidase [Aureimonas pseudogalii]